MLCPISAETATTSMPSNIGDLMLMTWDAVEKYVRASLAKLKKEYYKGSDLFYWRNANWGFKDRGVLYFKHEKTAEKE